MYIHVQPSGCCINKASHACSICLPAYISYMQCMLTCCVLTCSTSEWSDCCGGVWPVRQCNRQMGVVPQGCRVRDLRQLLGHNWLRCHWHCLLLLWSLICQFLCQICSGMHSQHASVCCIQCQTLHALQGHPTHLHLWLLLLLYYYNFDIMLN